MVIISWFFIWYLCYILGHCHPKNLRSYLFLGQKKLMNAHDFTTPVKEKLMEKMAGILPGKLKRNSVIFRWHISCGSSYPGCQGNNQINMNLSLLTVIFMASLWELSVVPRLYRGETYSYGPPVHPAFTWFPRPDPYRPLWTKGDGEIDTDAYISFYETFLKEGTVGNVAAFVLEPVQGWAGSIFPPDDFFPKLKKLCEKYKNFFMTMKSGRNGSYRRMAYSGPLGSNTRYCHFSENHLVMVSLLQQWLLKKKMVKLLRKSQLHRVTE